MNRCRCKLPDGMIVKPDGIHELDPCIYMTTEIYTNVTVEIRECIHCGRVDIVWVKQDNTERIDPDGD